MPVRDLRPGEIQDLVRVLAESAATSLAGPVPYLRNLAARAGLPQSWQMQLVGPWSGSPEYDARTLTN